MLDSELDRHAREREKCEACDVFDALDFRSLLCRGAWARQFDPKESRSVRESPADKSRKDALEEDFSLDLCLLALGGSLAHAVSQRILRKNPERPQVGKSRNVWG